MKKVWISLCVLVLCLSCSGCCLSHDWAEASCTSPETCTKCGEAQGEALGHDKGEFVTTETDLVAAVAKYEARCTRCEAVMESKEETMSKLYDEETGLFLFTPEEYFKRLQLLRAEATYVFFMDRYELDDNDGDHYSIDCFNETEDGDRYNGSIVFYDKDGKALADLNSREIASVQYFFWMDRIVESKRFLAELVVDGDTKLLACALDPALDLSDLDRVSAKQEVKNGIEYDCGYMSEGSTIAYIHRFSAPAGQ